MSSFSSVRNVLRAVWHELRIRFRLLAAAFARTPSFNADPPRAQFDILNGLNLAGQAAGLQVWDWDVSTNTLKFDRNLIDRYGGNAQDVERNPDDFIARAVCPEDLPHYRREFVRALKGDAPLCINYRVLHKDGSTHPVQLRGEVFRAAPSSDGQLGRAMRVIGFAIDMQSQIQSAQRIETQSEQQRQLIERLTLAADTAGLGVWDWDLKTNRLRSDDNMARIFDQTDAESFPTAQDFTSKIVHPDDLAAFRLAMDNAVKNSDRISHRYRHIHADGSVHHVQLHARVIRGPNKKALRLLAITWDITSEIEAQTEIERQSAAQRALFERLNLATEVAGIDVWDWDLVTDRFTADAHMADVYRGTHFDLSSGRALMANIVHPEDLAGYLEAIDRTIESGESLFHRYRMVPNDGNQRHVQAHARVFRDAEGKAVRLLGVSLDITEEVDHLTELRRQANEERALRDRLNLATETAGIGIWDKDLITGTFVSDEQFWKIFGLAPDDHFKVHNGIHPDEREQALTPLNVAFADANRDEILAIRHRTSNPRQGPQYVQTHMRVFRDADGKPNRLLGVTWDVTNEVLHAKELQRKADRERALVERLNVVTKAAGISPWEFDLKTNRFSWQGLRQEVYGLDHVPLSEYSAALAEIVLEEDRSQLTDPARHAIQNGINNYTYQFRVHGKDGKIHYMRNIAQLQGNARGALRYIMGITMDVTKEVEANSLLEQRAEENRQLIERLNIATESANIGSWEIDLVAQRFIWVENPVKKLGMADEDFGSLDEFATHLVPEDRSLLPDNIMRAVEDQTHRFALRYRAVAPDGAIIHVQTYGRVIVDEQNKPVRALGVSWDSTREVLDKEQLQKQAIRERELLDRLSVATQAAGISPWEFDLKTNQYTWFGARLTVLGLDEQPVDTYYDALKNILLPEDRDILKDAALEAMTTGVDAYSARYRAHGTDGQVHYLKNFVRVLRSPRGTPYRLIGVTWDISEEVAASERLEEQVQQAQALKERLSIAATAAGISPFEIDLTTGKFLWVENSIPALIGMRGSDNALTTFAQRIHPDDVDIFRQEMIRAAKGGYDIINYRYRAIANDGSIVHVQAYAKLYFNEKRRAMRALGVSWDVSREIAINVQLEQQAQKERALTERLTIATYSAGISTWEVDLIAKKFLWIENPLVATRGARDDGHELAKFSLRMHPDDKYLLRDAIRAAAKEKRDVVTYRYRCFRQDGTLAHIQAHAKLYFNEANRATRALGVSWEVSNEVESAEKLRDAERRLERASLSSSEGHWEAELATGNLWCSSSFHTLLGYIEGELETRVSAFDQLVHADDRATYHDALRKHLVDKERYDVETRMRMANGEYRWFRMRGMAERDLQDQPTVMAGSIHDVHQQKLVEDALDLAQRRFERAINGTQDGLWELDVATESAWCSPRLALLLGYPTAQLEAHNFLRSLMHPEDADKVAKVTQSHYRHNTPFDLEVRLKTNNDDYRWYRARATAERDGSGRAVRLSGSLQDVTEARAAREELVRATEAAEAASRAKSDFLANVSHEIRTPMNGIIGMTGLLLDTQLDRTQSDYANTIRGSADSLLTIINDILDFSKIEAGKLDLENIELNLRSNVEDVGAMMAFQAANKGLELIINVHPEVPEYVLGDPQRLRQCLINLVGNAIKFTKNGEIVVDVCAIGRHEGRVLTHFEVRDTGMGIPEKTLKTLFQPFVQADSSTTRHFGGTGLGLSIVRRLVEMMGGQVGVVSELGKGSNFFFTLSLEPKEHATPTPLTRNLSSDGRILIVDDNATNRRVLDALLTHQGYRVITAGSGAEALKQLQSSVENGSTSEMTIDMVITDFQMPDMDGLMLGEHIGNHPALANTRLVMLTSLDRQGDTKRLTELGFAAYLTKPVRTRELLDCVARVLSGEARQWQMEIRPMITRNSLSQSNAQQRFHGHVLVVEDNLVNQKVAARFLERLGCTVRIADHGADGVVAMEMEHFDIVFMDLQMPVMDGLTAARKIRELESADPTRRRTPIVTLTANAMRGDQERCETAGMDGFLTKPIEVERLRNTLAKFGLAVDGELPNPVGAIQIQPSSAETTLPAPIDLARLREITDGDAEFTRELIETFIVSGEQQLGEIHAAIGSADRDSLARAAHKLKGACANIYANALYTYASRLEAEARTARDEDLQSCHALLQQEFARAKHFLSSPSVVPVPVKAAS